MSTCDKSSDTQNLIRAQSREANYWKREEIIGNARIWPPLLLILLNSPPPTLRRTSDLIPGLPSNCSDVSDMLVRLVTPHLSAATTLGSTPPPLESKPEWLEEERGVTEPRSQGQECSPDLSKQTSTFPPLPLKKPNVHLILLQFHLSTHKPPPPPINTPSSFLFAFSSLPSSFFPICKSLTLPPPTAVAFQGCVFHAPVAGQAPGNFPRWGLGFWAGTGGVE